jgi:hypothetical protein
MFGLVPRRPGSKSLRRGMYTGGEIVSVQTFLERGDGRIRTRGSNQERYVNHDLRKTNAKTIRDGLDNTDPGLDNTDPGLDNNDPSLPSDEKPMTNFFEYFELFLNQ